MKKKKILGDVKSFIVNRKTWYRGKGSYNSCLINNSSHSCCLGFYARACGLDRKIIRNVASPQEVISLLDTGTAMDINAKEVQRKSNVIWNTKLVNISREKAHAPINTTICCKMMTINDSEYLSDEEREKKLTALFKKIGIKVTFK